MVITPVYDKDGNQVADIPVSAGDEIYADYYTIRDTLNEKILLDGLTVNTKTDSSDWVALEFGTDYTVLDQISIISIVSRGNVLYQMLVIAPRTGA